MAEPQGMLSKLAPFLLGGGAGLLASRGQIEGLGPGLLQGGELAQQQLLNKMRLEQAEREKIERAQKDEQMARQRAIAQTAPENMRQIAEAYPQKYAESLFPSTSAGFTSAIMNMAEYERRIKAGDVDGARQLLILASPPVVRDFGDRFGMVDRMSGTTTNVGAVGLPPEKTPSYLSDAAGAGVAGERKAGGGPAQKAIDTEFGKSYVEWQQAGGYPAVQKNLKQLKDASAALGKSDNLSGPVVGSLPDAANAFINPDAIDVRERVEEVAQGNLRTVLGGQFAEREGEKLVARAYNPKLGEKINQRRVNALAAQIEMAAQAKQDAIRYFGKHGTLAGFEGKIYTMADFDEFMNRLDAETIPQEGQNTAPHDGWSVRPK